MDNRILMTTLAVQHLDYPRARNVVWSGLAHTVGYWRSWPLPTGCVININVTMIPSALVVRACPLYSEASPSWGGKNPRPVCGPFKQTITVSYLSNSGRLSQVYRRLIFIILICECRVQIRKASSLKQATLSKWISNLKEFSPETSQANQT